MTDTDTTASEWHPWATREEFLAELQGMVTENAPAVFALCQEIGEYQDGVIAYWGLAHDDHTDLIGTGGSIHTGFRDATTAHERLARAHPTLHLIWA